MRPINTYMGHTMGGRGMQGYFFWFLLASLSVFFAEVTVASYLYPYFTPWGIISLLPLYGLHTLVLAGIVYRFGKPRFETLYLAGILFGLYEAYITKVVWNPEWDSVLKIGGVGIFEVLVVVLFWHPFMSFIIPLGVAELLTSGRRILPGIVLRHPYLTATLLGIVESSNAPSPLHSFLSTFSSSAFLILLVHIWLGRFKGGRYDMEGLLPTSKELKPLFLALLAYYIIFGSLLRREALPDLSAQAPIWLLYAATFFLLYRALKKSREHGEVGLTECRLELRRLSRLAGVFVISATIFTSIKTLALPELGVALIMALWAFASVVAVVSLVKSARWALTQ
ncbi:hypothetical protein [Thermococcus aciditolerans]|uniref:Uncharacterized protein n=1 Tax=Thermococcus aciditolerans TaxID=2598455 RepID=A0A5C0SKH8_9EURY|nr:hypothetical protein [Thermococcus aciditolerans]QEK13874.1 hypothetical protein FPV09_00670 [Thermococcus aciditolerans]